jgi:hypothetical protein
MYAHIKILCLFLAFSVIARVAESDEPAQVRPATGTIGGLRQASTDVMATVGERLDESHDWLYRRLQHWIENFDNWFVEPDRKSIVVPLSPLRIGFDSAFVHRHDGLSLVATPKFEATLRLPNIERRLKLFITSSDVQESPADPTLERNPVRAGLRFAPVPHIDFEVGARAKIWPAAFAALKWATNIDAGALNLYPFAKAYAESGLGFGVSGGVTLERWRQRWIMRSATYANWVRNTSATDWTQTFIVGYAPAIIQEQRYGTIAAGRDLACGMALRVSASGDRVSRTSLYEVGAFLKRPLHGGWLYGYVEPIMRWDRNYGWHPDVGVRIGFDALFWGLAVRPAEVASYCR